MLLAYSVLAQEDLEGLEDLELPGLDSLLWSTDASLRAWSGFHSNPQYSALNAQESALVAGSGDILVYRLPVDGWEFTAFGMLEHVVYLEEGIDPETLGLADIRGKRVWDSGWSAGAGLEYVFLRQVFDASEIEGFPSVVRAQGHTLVTRLLAGWSFAPGWEAEVEFEAGRQWLDAPLDDFWDFSPKLTLRREISEGHELGISYLYRARIFDDRAPLQSDGFGEESLAFHQHQVELGWRRSWGGGWWTSARADVLRSSDNGNGFYDYERAGLVAVLRWTRPRWEVRAETRLRWYRYPDQPGQDPGDDRRRAHMVSAARAEWLARKGVRAFVEYQFEDSDENVRAADYRAHLVTAGIAVEL
jgi:hypothetical protein